MDSAGLEAIGQRKKKGNALPPPTVGEEKPKGERGMFDLTQAESQMIALAQPEYEIAKMRREPGATKNLYQSDRRTIEEMRRKAAAYAADTARGENLYIRADPDGIHDIIFIDDTRQEAVDYLDAQGIKPACTVETSVKHGKASLHTWYRLSEPTDRMTRKAVEYTLIKKLHEQFPDPDPERMPGDYGSCDGGHLGRLAGSRNYGLTKPKDNAVVLVEATGYVLSADVTAALLSEAEENKKEMRKLDADLEEVKNHEYENIKIIQWYKENVVPRMRKELPHFRQDFFAVCAMLRAKFGEMDIKKVLWDHDPNPIQERKVGHEAHYLACTLYNARAEVGNAHSPKPSLPPVVGGGSALPFAGACASAAIDQQLTPATQEPDTETPYVPGGTGKLMSGVITPDGQILFGTPGAPAPAPKPQATASSRPAARRQFRLGVRRLGAAPRPTASPSPKPR